METGGAGSGVWAEEVGAAGEEEEGAEGSAAGDDSY